MPTLDLTNGLSVIIPFYNEGDNTVKAAKAAEEALAKTKLPFEILVVDDGSTDGANKKDFPENMIYIRKDHSGRVDTRLTGLKESRYENVLFVDARVWLHAGSLVNLVSEVEKNPNSTFWNGHLVMSHLSPLSSIWETLVGVGWRRISENETVKFGIEEFDRFPKGTGFFLASKTNWLYAFNKLKSVENLKLEISDDTKLLREFAKIGQIWISGKVSAQYVSRTTFKAFSRNCFYRGQTFVDSYWNSPTIFGKLVRWLFPLSICLAVLTFFFSGLASLFLLIFGSTFFLIGVFFLFSLKSWKNTSRAMKESLTLVPLIYFFAVGFAKSYVLGFRLRQNSEL